MSENHTTDQGSTATSIESARPRQKSPEGALLFVLGWTIAIGGVALAAAPRYSWTASKIATGLGEFGLQAGVVMLAGMGIMTVALVRRSVERVRAEMHSDDGLLLEQVAAEMAEQREVVGAIQDELRAVGQDLTELRAEARTLRDLVAQPPPSPISPDALFQLASSLDKLGMRLDARLKVHHATLQESIDELMASVEHSRRNLEDRFESVAAQSAPHALAEHAEWAQPAEDHTPAQAPAAPLGVLDGLDRVPAAMPSIAPAPDLDFDTLDQDARDVARELESSAPASHGSWDEQLMVDHGAGDETRAKLAQLQALLADERVRAAMEQARRA